MFEGLKKKFKDFVGAIAKKEEEKEEKIEHEAQSIEKQESNLGKQKEKIAPVAEPIQIEEKKPKEAKLVDGIAEEKREDEQKPIPTPIISKKPEKKEEKIPEPAPIKKPEEKQVANEHKAVPEAKKSAAVKIDISAIKKVKSILTGKIKIEEKDIDSIIEELNMGMLEADVNYDVAERFCSDLRTRLVGKEVPYGNVNGYINNAMRDALGDLLAKASPIDIISRVNSRADKSEPFKILFIGPNGAGKTTTMAKLANMLKNSDIQCVISASDTFRAAAIEQAIHHANILGIKVVSSSYGADPASVAFDACNYAKAHSASVVLIDSAGRQETNKSLIEEIKKVERVIKPDLKIFVGESIAGNALLDQIKAFEKATGIDGIILTKLDCDAKGGNTISILGDTHIPIMFFGIGEGYNDLMPYDPSFIIDNVVGG